MTLQQFLAATAGVPPSRLRQAMATALTVEPARTTAAYQRFYRRVVQSLGLTEEPRVPAARLRVTTSRSAPTATSRASAARRRPVSTAPPPAARP